MITLEELQEGIVMPINKPYRWTSFQAVNKVKAIIRNTYGIKKIKIGHAGTLDPLATGLLLICVGKATKTIPMLQDGDKVYTGRMVLGATTPCYDLEQAIDQRYSFEHITPELLEEKRKQFIGKILQVPPMFSAVKVDGQRAYEYARKDDHEVKIQPKIVEIRNFDVKFNYVDDVEKYPTKGTSNIIIDNDVINRKSPRLYDNPLGTIPANLPQVDFLVECGKGTYIRSLARDFGEALGSGAFLASLRREKVGDYTIEKAMKLDDVENLLVKQ